MHDFKYSPTKKITFEIYPNLESFHHAINWPTAPDWLIGQTSIDTIQRVSPHNPGPYHTYESVMTFITSMYNHHDSIPRWLHQGVALYKAEFFSKNVSEKFALHISSPTLQQLEAIAKDDTTAFDELDGFRVSYSLVQFIDHGWGWESILDVLEDYSQFEEILNINKELFIQLWKEYILSLHSTDQHC